MNPKSATLLVLLASMLTMVGCHGGSKRSIQAFPLESSDIQRLRYNVIWVADLKTPRTDRISRTTLLNDAIVLIEEPRSLVSSVSLRTGEVTWRKVVGRPNEQLFEPYLFDDQLLFNSETQLMKLHRESGRLTEVAELEAVVNDRPAVVGNYAVYGGINGRVFAHDITTGFSKWAYQMPGGILTRPVEAGVNIFAVDSLGVYKMFNGATGDLLWDGKTFGRVSVPPAVSPLGVFIACEDQTLYAINRSTGRDNWRFPAGQPLTASPRIFTNTLFVPRPSKGLIALDARSGRVLWEIPQNAKPLILTDSRLLLHDRTSIYVIDPPTGKIVLQVPVQPLANVLVGPNNSLILITERGRMIRMDPQG